MIFYSVYLLYIPIILFLMAYFSDKSNFIYLLLRISFHIPLFKSAPAYHFYCHFIVISIFTY